MKTDEIKQAQAKLQDAIDVLMPPGQQCFWEAVMLEHSGAVMSKMIKDMIKPHRHLRLIKGGKL